MKKIKNALGVLIGGMKMNDNLKEFLELVKDAPYGYKGSFFSIEDMIKNYEIIKPLSLNTPNKSLQLLKLINFYEIKNKTDEYKNYKKLVLNNIQSTDISNYGFNEDKLARINSEYVWNKNPHFLYSYLHLKDENYINDNLLFEHYDIIIDKINNKKGAILSLFHWGIFQSFIPIFLTKKIKVNFVANYYACMYLKGMIDLYIPNLSKYLDFIIVGDPAILKKSVSRLKQGEFICILPELSLGIRKPKLTNSFLGKEIYIPEGIAIMSILSECDIIPCYIEENGSIGYKVNFLPPINHKYKSLDDKDKLSIELFNILENEVLKNPYKWCGWEILNRMST